MKLIQFIFAFILIALKKIVKSFIKNPRLSSLLIFGIWVNPLPLFDENLIRDNSIIPI